MRIAYLSQSYPPMVSGASLAVQTLAEGMAQRGHQVLVITSSNLVKPYLETKKNLMVYRGRSYINPFRVGQRYASWSHLRTMKLLRDFAPDLIHAHDPFQFAYTGLKYCKKKSIPITITTHQLPWFVRAYLPEWLKVGNEIEDSLWRYSNWLLRKFDTVISPTATIADVIWQKTGLIARVINYGIELDCFQVKNHKDTVNDIFRKKFNIPLGAPILLHVGRLDVDKNVEIVLRAVAGSMMNNGSHLLVVGDGTEKERLVKLCKDLGIDERSHFPGYIISRRDLAAVYRLADVFITASEIETQGIVLIEAAACGLPIVAVDATCISEIVTDGVNGYLTAPKDVQGLADCLNKILANPEVAMKMGQAGHLVSKKFGMQKTIASHENLYGRTILMSNPSRSATQRVFDNLRFPQV